MKDQGIRPVAVVSGAAKGIGRACVEAFSNRGWRVFAIDLDDTMSTIFPSSDIVPLAFDISDADALASAWKSVDAPVSALVNSAGVFPPTTLAQMTLDQYRKIFDVNVLGTLLLSQLASRDMVEGGAIVNLSSINGFLARADQILYAATKAAVLSLTRSMAADLAPRGIRVNGIAPGPVDTEGFRAIPGRAEEAAKQAPLGRVQSPKEVADIALWLVESEGAQSITGETIVSSGGIVMR